MHHIQIHLTVVGLKATLSPGFKLLGQCAVEAAHCTGTGGNSHESGSDLPDFVGTHPAHKHLGQRFGHLWFVPVVALEHLTVKCSFPISWHLQIFNAPGWGNEITRVGSIALPSAIRGAFTPGCSAAMLELLTHHLFDQDLNRTHGQAT